MVILDALDWTYTLIPFSLNKFFEHYINLPLEHESWHQFVKDAVEGVKLYNISCIRYKLKNSSVIIFE